LAWDYWHKSCLKNVDEKSKKSKHKKQYLFLSDGKNCKTCERISSILETKTSELEDSGIKVVKLSDKKAAKQNGILSVPGLTFYKGGKGSNFEGKFKG
jgi:hypothetical protein